jgi:hypothetical protein
VTLPLLKIIGFKKMSLNNFPQFVLKCLKLWIGAHSLFTFDLSNVPSREANDWHLKHILKTLNVDIKSTCLQLFLLPTHYTHTQHTRTTQLDNVTITKNHCIYLAFTSQEKSRINKYHFDTLINKIMQEPVTNACNPSYLESWDWEGHGSRSA